MMTLYCEYYSCTCSVTQPDNFQLALRSQYCFNGIVASNMRKNKKLKRTSVAMELFFHGLLEEFLLFYKAVEAFSSKATVSQ